MIAAFTTSLKATAGGVIAFLSPLYVLVQSEVPIGWREALASMMAGIIGWLGVWAPSNKEPVPPYEPRHRPVDAS